MNRTTGRLTCFACFGPCLSADPLTCRQGERHIVRCGEVPRDAAPHTSHDAHTQSGGGMDELHGRMRMNFTCFRLGAILAAVREAKQ